MHGMKHLHHRRHNQQQRDEGNIEHSEVDDFRDIIRLEMTHVELLPADHPRIIPQFPDQLIRADIEGVHF